jgi:Uma2 family endonuclease
MTYEELPGRQPDVLFVATARQSRLKSSHLHGPADFVVEVISAGSRRLDRVEKFQEYEQGGIPEYLILDPDRRQVELYRLVNGRYEEVAPDAAGVLRIESVPGFWIRLDWFTGAALPSTAQVLRDLGV